MDLDANHNLTKQVLGRAEDPEEGEVPHLAGLPSSQAAPVNTKYLILVKDWHSNIILILFQIQVVDDDANLGLQQVLQEQVQACQGLGPQVSTQEFNDRFFL